MPKFSYTIKDAQGKTLSDTTDAFDQETLIKNLQDKGFYIIKLEEAKRIVSSPSKKKVHFSVKKSNRFTHNKVKLDDLLIFCRQLATMLEAGVTLTRSLNVIALQVESRNFAKVLQKVTANVEGGNSLSRSLAKHPKVFNQFWISLVEVGEASGTMPNVLNKLVFYLEQQDAFRSTVTSAAIYPAILFFIANFAIIFFAFFVGPRFETIFDSFGVGLPLITVILLATFNFIKTKFLVLAGIFGAILWLGWRYAHTFRGKLQTENLFFNFPVFGRIYKLIIVERFTSQMSLLIESGVPILYALDITERLVNNKTCELIISDVKNDVREGGLLMESMSKSKFFPPMALQMILVGEETGDLGKMLNHVADFYQKTVEIFLKRFSTIIEPIMLVFMGTIIGIIVIAMFLPMFNIAQLR